MSKEDGKALRIAALKAAAVAKQQRAAENLDKAINKLVKNNQPMSFANGEHVNFVRTNELNDR